MQIRKVGLESTLAVFQPRLYILIICGNWKKYPYIPVSTEDPTLIRLLTVFGGIILSSSYPLILEFLALPIFFCMKKYGDLIF